MKKVILLSALTLGLAACGGDKSSEYVENCVKAGAKEAYCQCTADAISKHGDFSEEGIQKAAKADGYANDMMECAKNM